MVKTVAFADSPCTRSRCASGSTFGMPEWLRSKCRSEGVIVLKSDCSGVFELLEKMSQGLSDSPGPLPQIRCNITCGDRDPSPPSGVPMPLLGTAGTNSWASSRSEASAALMPTTDDASCKKSFLLTPADVPVFFSSSAAVVARKSFVMASSPDNTCSHRPHGRCRVLAPTLPKVGDQRGLWVGWQGSGRSSARLPFTSKEACQGCFVA